MAASISAVPSPSGNSSSNSSRWKYSLSPFPLCAVMLHRSPCPVPRTLYVAQLHRFSQRRQWVPLRNKLMRHIAGEPRVGNRGAYGAIVQLLAVVNFVPARHATRMEVGDVRQVVANRADDISFHDLHVVDVVQQLHAR